MRLTSISDQFKGAFAHGRRDIFHNRQRLKSVLQRDEVHVEGVLFLFRKFGGSLVKARFAAALTYSSALLAIL